MPQVFLPHSAEILSERSTGVVVAWGESGDHLKIEGAMKQQKGFRVDLINHVRSRLRLNADTMSECSKSIIREMTSAAQSKQERDRILRTWTVSANTARTAFKGGKVTLVKHEAIVRILIHVAKERKLDDLLPAIEKLREDSEDQVQIAVDPSSVKKSVDPFIDFWPSRLAWNAQNLGHIITHSSKLLIVDSYHGPKDYLWNPLGARLKENRPIEAIILCLAPTDPFLTMCLSITKTELQAATVDRIKVKNIAKEAEPVLRKSKSSILFETWDGPSPGPIVFWKEGTTRSFGLGFWQQTDGSTDTSPWLAIHGGPFFDSLLLHCHALFRKRKIPLSFFD